MGLPALDSLGIFGESSEIRKYYHLVDEEFNIISDVIKKTGQPKKIARLRVEYFLFLYMIEFCIRDYYMEDYTDNIMSSLYQEGLKYIDKMARECQVEVDVSTDCMKYLASFVYSDSDVVIEDTVYDRIIDYAMLEAEIDYDVAEYHNRVENYLKPWTKQFIVYMEGIYKGLVEYKPNYESNKAEDGVMAPEFKGVVCSECKKDMRNQKYVYYIFDFGKEPLCMACFEKKTENYIPLHYEKKDLQTGYVVGGAHINYDMSSDDEESSQGITKRIIANIKRIFD